MVRWKRLRKQTLSVIRKCELNYFTHSVSSTNIFSIIVLRIVTAAAASGVTLSRSVRIPFDAVLVVRAVFHSSNSYRYQLHSTAFFFLAADFMQMSRHKMLRK